MILTQKTGKKMRIKDSIQRLGWRLLESVKKNKGFLPNENDIQAFNNIVEYYTLEKKDNQKNNELCFKMYLWHRVEMMKHYNSDVFDEIPQRKLVEALYKNSDVYIKKLTDFLNNREYNVLTVDLPYSDKPHYLLNSEQKKEITKRIRDIQKNNPEFLKAVKGNIWNEEDVRDNIVAEFNQLLFNYNALTL